MAHESFDDPEVASTVGLHVTLLKIGAFGLGAFIAGVAGALYAHYMFYIESNNFNFLVSAMAILFVILGAWKPSGGSRGGNRSSAILPEVLRFMKDWRLSLYGAVLVSMMIFRPSGILTIIGLVSSKDLGKATGKVARAMKKFNPDKTWKDERFFIDRALVNVRSIYLGDDGLVYAGNRFKAFAETGFTLSELCAFYFSRTVLECLAGAPFSADLKTASTSWPAC
jgi:hypothetical protein